MRRPSHDGLAAEARNSPHMNSQGDDLPNQSKERRKSIFPSLGSRGTRGSIRPGMGFGLAANKAKGAAGKVGPVSNIWVLRMRFFLMCFFYI